VYTCTYFTYNSRCRKHYRVDLGRQKCQLNMNAFGAPYDYRYTSVPALARNGFIAQLQSLVEKASALSGCAHVMFVGHSNWTGPRVWKPLTAPWIEVFLRAATPTVCTARAWTRLTPSSTMEPFPPVMKRQKCALPNGDGHQDQDLVDDTFCEVWAGSGAMKSQAKGFPGVEHMEMTSYAEVLEAVRSILESYNI